MNCPHCKNEIKDNSKFCTYCHKPIIQNIKKIRLKRNISALFFSIISLITIPISYISLLFIVIASIFIVASFNDNKHLSIFNIILVIVAFTTLVMQLIDQNKIVKEQVSSIITGEWGPLPNGGYYDLYSDGTYYQALEKDNDNNFCKGTYDYFYGYESPGEEEKIIERDTDFAYYTVTLIPSECVINGKKENNLDYLTIDRNLVLMLANNSRNKDVVLNVTTKVFNEVEHKK